MVRTRVLLVDDSESVGETVTALEDAGCRVTVAKSESETLRTLQNDGIDLVVTEIELPDGNGIELLEEIKAIHETLPVVVYTAHGDEATASDAIDAGVAGYIPKSRTGAREELAEKVDELAVTDVTGVRTTDLPSPTAETIIRAVDEAPVGITISDPSLPDNPLIYLNDAYEEMTGYSKQYVLGQNCRLLQGPDTDEKPVAEMREAIEDEKPVSVELINYREDGTPFWNSVTIAPLFNDEGEVTHYVGFQDDVTDRKEAEAMAKQRADSLREERQVLERVLARVSGLVNEVSQILVNAATREEIEREICAKIQATEGYTHAWVGESQVAGAGVTVRVNKNDTHKGLSTELTGEWSETIFSEALEEGSVKVSSNRDNFPAGTAPDGFDATSLAVVPLTYRRTTYGFLTIYAERSGVLDRRECKILEAIGQMIASGINAVETKKILTGDRVTELGFEITDDSFPLIELATVTNGSVTYNGSTITDDNTFRVFVTMTNPDEEFQSVIDRCPNITDGYIIAEQDDNIAVSLELEETVLFRDLAEYGATLRDLSVLKETGTAKLRIDLPVDGDARSVLSELESVYDGVNLIRQHERERDPQPTAEFIAAVGDRLTDRQYTALETAYLSDYFEFPRPISGEELAGSMNISRQTYHQHLRAAQRKLLDEFFESN